MAKKERADELLVKQKIAKNRGFASRLIMAGQVYTSKEELIRTAGERWPVDTIFYLKRKSHPYVSRGGIKLAHALDYFDIDLADQIVLDIGSSTGGFTDVALRAGAKTVYALDVGTNQLDWKLRSHDQVVVMEQTNFRYSVLEDFKAGQPDFACTDVSFISLDLIFPPLQSILKADGSLVALIKPQFEAKPEQVPEGGIITDPKVYSEVLHKVIQSAIDHSFTLIDLCPSPITGGKGNHEFLAHFQLTSDKIMSQSEDLIESVLRNFS